MAKLVIHAEKLTREIMIQLMEVCPFNAIEEHGDSLTINAACKMCQLCVTNGPAGIIQYIEEQKPQIDKSQWKGITVYVDHVEGQVHPVTYELLGKARELAAKINHPVYAVFMGHGIQQQAEEILHFGIQKVFVYDQQELAQFRIEPYTAAFEDFIKQIKPSSVLVGATTIGRSLAPRVAARFQTGLTADCTVLDIKENTDLVQIRPAFGGNIMARILTANHRPQFCTVRYKIMNAPERSAEKTGEIVNLQVPAHKLTSKINVLQILKKEVEQSISDAEVIVVAGRALKAEKDLAMINELADLLGAHIAGTRPLIEAGWVDPRKQIGLSGRTVKPKLIITCGVSGSVQFIAGMNNAECIIAINTDENAQIFNVAHYGIIGDIYEVVPVLIDNIKKKGAIA